MTDACEGSLALCFCLLPEGAVLLCPPLTRFACVLAAALLSVGRFAPRLGGEAAVCRAPTARLRSSIGLLSSEAIPLSSEAMLCWGCDTTM